MIYYFLAALSISSRKYADNWQNAKKCSKILRRMQREVRYCCTVEMVLIRIEISCCRTQKSRCPVCRAAALKNAKKVRCSVVSAADRSARRQCRQTLPAGWSPPAVRAGTGVQLAADVLHACGLQALDGAQHALAPVATGSAVPARNSRGRSLGIRARKAGSCRRRMPLNIL